MKSVLMCMMMCAVCLLTGTVFGAIPTGFDWNLTDVDQINKVVDNIPEGSKDSNYWNRVMNIIKKLADKTPENTTYDQFKTICKEVAPTWVDGPAVIGTNVKRFNVYLEKMLIDPQLKDLNYVKSWVKFIVFRDNSVTFRNEFFAKNGIFETRPNDAFITRVLDVYRKYMHTYSDEEIKADMKKLKRFVYPNISKGENYKKIAVEVELLMKSVE